MEPSPFYPSALPPPELLQGGSFIARPLRAADAALDHAAYMASPDVIRAHSGGRWPTEQFTLAEDAAQIAQHEREHAARSSFTFTLLAPDMAQCLGCLYILPLQPFLQRHRAQPIGTPATAMVTFWVRQDRQENDLPDQVARAAHAWLRDAWPFNGHVFRVNQAERRSALALGRAGLRRVAAIDMAAPPHRYDLYQA